MNNKYCFSLFLVLGYLDCFADQLKFIELDRGSEPNHLVPISKLSSDSIDKDLEGLKIPRGKLAWMIAEPASGLNYSLCLRYEISEDLKNKYNGMELEIKENEKDYFLSYSELIVGNQHLQKNDEANAAVELLKMKISYDLAVIIQRVWARFILDSRYPKFSYSGNDGVNYIFGSWVTGLGEIRGEIWSPETGLPSKMVVLVKDLIESFKNEKLNSDLKSKVLREKLMSAEKMFTDDSEK